MTATEVKNVLGGKLESCCFDPQTGFYRDGYCNTDKFDRGRHIVCAVMTDEFLLFSKQHGNDLITPRHSYDFPGLNAGDKWCLCVLRWRQALENNVAPKVILASCHAKCLDYVSLKTLQEYAY